MQLGLEGSEINEYLQQIAAGINEWKVTGIPFNQGSLQDMADRLGALGMAGPRAMRVAGGLIQAARGVARGGPQDVGQLMMLQTLGGLQPGRASMDDIEDALIRLEKAQFGGEEMDKLIRSLFMAGGGGAEGRRVAYGLLQRLGVQVSRAELRMLGGLQAGQLTPEMAAEMAETPGGLRRAVEFMGGGEETRERLREMLAEAGVEITPKEMRRRLEEAAVAPEAAARFRTPEALTRVAAAVVPPELKRQATLVNKQITTGFKLIGAMQNLENTAQTITKEIAARVGPILEKLTGSLDGLTTEITKLNQRTAEASGLEVGP
jgi:hypothetical protein